MKLDAFEVAEAFEVPLHFLMNPAHHRHHAVVLDGIERRFISMPWQGPEREYFIWGRDGGDVAQSLPTAHCLSKRGRAAAIIARHEFLRGPAGPAV